jgi:S1-C subfamily serine protease
MCGAPASDTGPVDMNEPGENVEQNQPSDESQDDADRDQPADDQTDDAGQDQPAQDDAGDPDQQGSSLENRQYATWQVFWGTDYTSGMGTAFAIDTHLLATNAHITGPVAEALSAPSGWAILFQHETGETATVANVWQHPDYQDSLFFAPDVGIIEVDQELATVLPIASREEVQSIQVGDDLEMCGFPGDVAQAIDLPPDPDGTFRPRTTCLSGDITALRPFDSNEASTPENTQFVQHDLATTGGTSGSAIVNEDGKVVAINASGTVDEAGLNRFAARADTLLDMLEIIADGSLAPIAIEEVSLPDFVPTCPNLGFYSYEWFFGFDPPVGFLGPFEVDVTQLNLPGFLYWQQFVSPGYESSILAAVLESTHASLGDAAIAIGASRVRDGFVFYDSEAFYMANGRPLLLIYWRNPRGHVSVDALALADGYLFALIGGVHLPEYEWLYLEPMLASLETMCVD